MFICHSHFCLCTYRQKLIFSLCVTIETSRPHVCTLTTVMTTKISHYAHIRYKATMTFKIDFAHSVLRTNNCFWSSSRILEDAKKLVLLCRKTDETGYRMRHRWALTWGGGEDTQARHTPIFCRNLTSEPDALKSHEKRVLVFWVLLTAQVALLRAGESVEVSLSLYHWNHYQSTASNTLLALDWVESVRLRRLGVWCLLGLWVVEIPGALCWSWICCTKSLYCRF